MPVALLWLQLLGTAAFILIASNFLARSADIIALKTGLGRSFIGVVLLATATSLPELGTGVSSITLVGATDLAAGDAFGSNVFNLLIIGLLDIFWRDGPILTRVSLTSVIVGALGIAIIAVAATAIFIHGVTDALSGWYISPFSIMSVIRILTGKVVSGVLPSIHLSYGEVYRWKLTSVRNVGI
jgi:cation:H+ antiporter